MRILGLDIGGTQVKGGWIESSELPTPDRETLMGRLSAIDTVLSNGSSAFLDDVAGFARDLGFDGRLGVGVPGVFHTENRRIERSANMPEIDGIQLALELAKRLDVSPEDVVVDNDANAAAFGEQWLGGGRGLSDLALITLGTGIGGGVVSNGEIFRGPAGRGGEIGHLVVQPLREGEAEEEGLRCGCGAYGCLERLASATAAMRRAEKAGLPGDLKVLSERAAAGSAAEIALYHAIGRDLGAGILSVLAVFDITEILIGGGLGNAWPHIEPGVHEILAERSYGSQKANLRAAELGEHAGWIGAARCAIEPTA